MHLLNVALETQSMAHHGPQMAQRWLQNGSKILKNGSKRIPKEVHESRALSMCASQSPEWPRMAQESLRMAPEGFQNGSTTTKNMTFRKTHDFYKQLCFHGKQKQQLLETIAFSQQANNYF